MIIYIFIIVYMVSTLYRYSSLRNQFYKWKTTWRRLKIINKLKLRPMSDHAAKGQILEDSLHKYIWGILWHFDKEKSSNVEFFLCSYEICIWEWVWQILMYFIRFFGMVSDFKKLLYFIKIQISDIYERLKKSLKHWYVFFFRQVIMSSNVTMSWNVTCVYIQCWICIDTNSNEIY